MERNISIHISDRSHYNLTLNVYYCGNLDVTQEYVYKPDHYIFFFVREGKGSVTVRQVSHKVESGQGFVAFPGEETRVKSNYKNQINVTYVAFSGYLVERYLSRACLTAYEPVFADTPDGELRQMFETLLKASTRTATARSWPSCTASSASCWTTSSMTISLTEPRRNII